MFQTTKQFAIGPILFQSALLHISMIYKDILAA